MVETYSLCLVCSARCWLKIFWYSLACWAQFFFSLSGRIYSYVCKLWFLVL